MKNGIGWCLVIMAVWINSSNALNITAVKKIGDPPVPRISWSQGYVLDVNGSVYDIGEYSNVMVEFDVATKQWSTSRNFKSIQRNNFDNDYFALGNRMFAVLVPDNSRASNPLFFYWDKDAGEFKSLSVVVDPSAMPSLTSRSDFYWAIGVPDKAGSDAYFAIVNYPTSEAVFSKLHVEFNGSVPSHGELKAFHRATLPAGHTVGYLVLNKDVVYWFLRFRQDSFILDTKYGYYYNLTSNEAGNMSISTSDGSKMYPAPGSYLIGDSHVLALGYINLHPLFWVYEFASRQWTPVSLVNVPFQVATGYDYSVDVANRLIYIVSGNRVVIEAKFNI